MPAHITHELFAEAVFDRLFAPDSRALLDRNRRFWVFGAQGPDFFLHNHRTRPSGLIFGRVLHGSGYGTCTGHLVRIARKRGEGLDSPLGAFVLGFATHAMLDRHTHPYINYASGWVDREHPESVRFTNCHAFLERIIDVLMLKLLRGITVTDYDFLERIDLGESFPEELQSAIARAIESTCHEYQGQDDLEERIGNAYTDTMNFYRFTNPPERHHLIHAWERDGGGDDPTRRLLALFHPDTLPDLDYLNGAGAAWNHPGDRSEIHHESVPELFDAAVDTAEHAVDVVRRALEGAVDPNRLVEAVATAIGDGNLSDGRTRKAKRRLECVDPLPLDEALAVWYQEIRNRRDRSASHRED